MKGMILGVALILFCGATLAVRAQTTQEDVIAAIQDSHITANVPDKANFDSFLRRDIGKYFKEKTGKELEITYELLRNGPTQVGIGFPKFYVWVVALADGKVAQEGALRVSAMGKTHFSVTHYLSKADAASSPEKLVTIFPEPVVEKIKLKLKPTLPKES